MQCAFPSDPGPDAPAVVRMIVEVPKGSSNKYEYDPSLGVFKLSRPLYSPLHYPGDYGFTPGTAAEDGDPLDILSLVTNPSYPGILVYVRPVAVLDMIDSGTPDQKVIAVPERDPRFDSVQSCGDRPAHVRREIEHFFDVYKDLEGKVTKMAGWRDIGSAHQLINESRRRYLAIERRRNESTS